MLIAAWQQAPSNRCQSVADRDQRPLTVSAPLQANARNLAKRDVDHAARTQSILARFAFPRQRRRLLSESHSWVQQVVARDRYGVIQADAKQDGLLQR
jgi:hypothetical protein